MDNQFYNELVLTLRGDGSLSGKLEWMAAHGQSVMLNYGEDDRQWECSWITGGIRFTAVRGTPMDAVRDVLGAVRTAILMLEHPGIWGTGESNEKRR